MGFPVGVALSEMSLKVLLVIIIIIIIRKLEICMK